MYSTFGDSPSVKDLKPIVAERISLVQCFQTLSEMVDMCPALHFEPRCESCRVRTGPMPTWGTTSYMSNATSSRLTPKLSGRGCRPLRVDSCKINCGSRGPLERPR